MSPKAVRLFAYSKNRCQAAVWHMIVGSVKKWMSSSYQDITMGATVGKKGMQLTGIG